MLDVRTRFGAPLEEFVDCLWYSTGEARSHRRERLLPTGCVDVVFKLREDGAVRVFREEGDAAAEGFGGAAVSGAYARHYAIDTTRPSPTLGVHFRPGGAAGLLGVPLSELTDRHLGLEEVWGREAGVLRERLMEAANVSSRFDLVERALLERLSDPPGDYPAIMRAVGQLSCAKAVRVKAVRELMGYRSKRFIRLFRASVGLTPKLFGRIRRFQAVLDRIAGDGQVAWADAALEGGYCDQSHLIRDFRTFAGVTPSEYRPVEPGHKNHLAVVAEADHFFQYGPDRPG